MSAGSIPRINRNVEIKARLRDLEKARLLAEHLSDTPCRILRQYDTFFNCRSAGRLKLRTFGEQHGELIYYERPDTATAKVSRYCIIETDDAQGLAQALASACGVAGRVTKTRFLFIAGQTRIHIDRVEGLGDFLELEVTLRPDQSEESGRTIAEDLARRLGIESDDLVDRAYVDLLADVADRKSA